MKLTFEYIERMHSLKGQPHHSCCRSWGRNPETMADGALVKLQQVQQTGSWLNRKLLSTQYKALGGGFVWLGEREGKKSHHRKKKTECKCVVLSFDEIHVLISFRIIFLTMDCQTSHQLLKWFPFLRCKNLL